MAVHTPGHWTYSFLEPISVDQGGGHEHQVWDPNSVDPFPRPTENLAFQALVANELDRLAEFGSKCCDLPGPFICGEQPATKPNPVDSVSCGVLVGAYAYFHLLRGRSPTLADHLQEPQSHSHLHAEPPHD